MAKTTVLIVEDEEIVAADLAGRLEQLGYEVVGTAAKGEEAVESACRLKPQVVLMDIRLKGAMDGIEAAEAILRRHSAPVIYLTAHSDQATLERAKLSQPYGYIIKPFEERELSTTIEMALYKHQSDLQLREQREWLRVTLTSIGDAVITCDTDGLITFLNPVAEALTGWSAEEARERPVEEIFRLINEETRQPSKDPVDLVLREGHPKSLANHTALVTRSGLEIPIEDSAAPILDAGGRVIGVVLVFHDVTEKRRAEEALRESASEQRRQREFLECVIANAGACIAVVQSHDLRYTMANAAFQSFAPDGPMVGRTYREVFPEAAAGAEALLRRVLETGEPWEVENYRAPVPGNPDATWQGRVVRLPVVTGEAPSALAVVWDITERRRIEDAERASRTKLAAAFGSITEAVFIADADGRLIDFNDEFVRYHRFKDRDECSRTIDDCPMYLEAYFEDGTPAPIEQWAMPRALRGETASSFEYRLRRKETGETWWGSYSFAPILDKDGGIGGAIVSAREITALKLAEEAMRESEAKYRNLFQNMVEEVHFWRLVRDEDGRIKTWTLVDANPPTLKSWGRPTLDEIKDKTTDEIFGPGATEHYLPFVQKIMTSGEPYSFEDYFPHLDKHFRFTAVPLGDHYIVTGADITDIIKAKLALSESEERLRLLGNNLPESAVYQYVHEPDSGASFTYVSAGIERINGVTPEEILRDAGALHRQIPPEFTERLIQAEARSKHELSDFDMELPMRKPDGEVRWMQLRSRPRRMPGGRTVWDGVQTDITDRKIAEVALRESEERYRLLFESSLQAIFTLDCAGRILLANPASTRISGYSLEELTNKDFAEFCAPDLLPATQAAFLDVLNGVPREIEITTISKNGRRLELLVSGAPMIEAGSVRGIFCVAIEITDRKRAEEALRRYELLAGHSRDIMLFVEFDTGQILEANAAAITTYGYTREELLERTIHDLRSHKTRDVTPTQMAESASRGIQFETVHQRKDGSTFPVEVSSQGAMLGGTHTLVSVVRNISARKQSEEALLESDLRFRLATETTGVGIWEWNVITNQIRWDAQMFRIYGIAPSKDGFIQYNDWSEAVLPEDLPKQEELLHNTACHGGQCFREFRIRRRENGACRDIQAVETVRNNAQGQIEWVVGTNLDITERKQSEANQAALAAIVKFSEDAIIGKSLDGTITSWNPGAEHLFGYLAVEMIGQSIIRIIPPELQLEETDILERLKQGQSITHFETERLAKDGRRISISLTVSPIRDVFGVIIGASKIARDITQRKQAEGYRNMGQDILLALSEYTDQREAIKRVFQIIKSATGVEAVGIRLQDEEDFPYFYLEGFPEDFLLKENSLLARTQDGGICRDECGDICLECTCGLVVTSKTDPSSPLFTKGGSSWTNDSFPFLHVPVDDDIRTNPRNECIHQGFASVALIPIRAKGRVVGLLQLNDRRKGRFTLEGIETLEKIAENIGESMLRNQAEEALRESEQRFRLALKNSPVSVAIQDRNLVYQWAYNQKTRPTDEIIGKTDADLFAPEEVVRINEDKQRVLETGAEEHVAHWVTSNGQRLFLDLTYEPIRDTAGNVTGIGIAVVNLTKQKLAEEALQESEQRLRLAYIAANAGTWEWDLTTNQNIWSDGTWELYGLTPHSCEPSYEVWLQTIHPDDRTRAMQAVQEAARDGKELSVEWRVGNLGGAERWLMARGQPLRNGSDAVVRFIGIVLDITARKQVEQELRRQSEAALHLSEREFRSLAESMPQIVWATRPDGWNIYFNQQWVDYTGLTMEESYGHGWNTPFHPDDKQRAWDAWQRATQFNERYSLECRLRRADGVYRWWLVRGEPMRGANGEILKWFGTCTDIEELKRAEVELLKSNYLLEQRVAERTTELSESENQFRVLTQNLQSAVALINENGEFTIVNRAFLRIFELDDCSTIKNVNDCDWGHWQVFDENGSLLDVDQHPVRKAALTSKPVRDMLVAVKAPENPNLKWLLVSAEPILDAQNHIHRIICTYHDITDRKRDEEAMKRMNDELEERVAQRTAELRERDQMLLLQSRQAAMGEMIGNIAHQWRQPLNTLGLSIQQLELYYELGEFTEEILTNSVGSSMDLIEYMSKTIDDFRNYFKPDKEKVEFKVREAVENTLTLIADSFRNKHIVVEVAANGDPVIYGYRNEFAQVLLNILNNAADVLSERESSEPKVTITFGAEGDHSFVTIADNGGGIPEEIMNKVFDPYFTTKGPQQGTGVGLYMSKTIIEKNMGGKLSVQNMAEGAEFRIEV